MAARRQPSGAQRRMQTPLAAAVRAAVISPASMIPIGNPVAASLTTITPEMYGSPCSLFAGKPDTHFSAATSVVREVRGHRVDERVVARVDPRLRRELDPAGGHRPVDPLDEIDLLGDGWQKLGNLLPSQVDDVVAHCGGTITAVGSTTKITRSSPGARYGYGR